MRLWNLITTCAKRLNRACSWDNTDVKLHPDIDGIIEAIKLKDVALVASRMGPAASDELTMTCWNGRTCIPWRI